MPDVSGWPQREQAYFIKLKSLIEDYARGMSMNRRLLQEGIPWQTLLRKFSHCVTLKADGQVVGWNALIPYKRVSPFKRVAPPIKAGRSDQGGLSGVLNAFLRANPEISNSLNEYLWRAATRKQGSEAGIRLTSVHEYFIHIVRKHGFAEDAWPLNTVTQAESSIRRYAKRFIRENYDDIVAHQFGRTAAAKARTGTGYATRLRSTLPLDVVELDEHSVDFIGSIGIKTPDGMRWVEMRRATIILLADRKGCVLSFKVTFRREANTDDILDVLAIAFGEAPDVGYYTSTYDHLKGALPVSLGGSLARCAFNLLEVDGALTHLADEGFYPDFTDTFKRADTGQKECSCRREGSSAQSSNAGLLSRPASRA